MSALALLLTVPSVAASRSDPALLAATSAEKPALIHAQREPPSESNLDAHGSTFKAGIGVNYDRLFAVNTYGGDVSLAIGRRDYERWGYLMLHLEKGSTEHGLSVWGFRVGPSMEWAFGRVRFGGEGTVGYLTIRRITRDAWMDSFSLGAELSAAFDFAVLSDSDALYLKAGFGADYYGEPIAWGPNLTVGYRWDEHVGR